MASICLIQNEQLSYSYDSNVANEALMKIISFLLVLIFSCPVVAQEENIVESTQSDIILVFSCGLGGAILGLSTLSFVDEPKDHTKNILVGASLGIIAGVILAAYGAAGKSHKMFEESNKSEQTFFDPKKFETTSRNHWHLAHNKFYQDKVAPDQVRLNFTF